MITHGSHEARSPVDSSQLSFSERPTTAHETRLPHKPRSSVIHRMEDSGNDSEPSQRPPSNRRVARRRTHRRTGPFNPALVGLAAHEIIGQLCAEGLRTPDFATVSAAVRAHAVLQAPTTPRQAAWQWLCSCASVYFRLFAPAAEWLFVGAEVAVPGSCLDLVWRNVESGEVMADELKSGIPGFISEVNLNDQIARQLSGARETYGAAFAGIRVILLSAPARSFFAGATGTRETIGGSHAN